MKAAGVSTPVSTRLERFSAKLSSRPWVGQIDEMLEAGHSSRDVMDYIRCTLMEFTDVKDAVLLQAITARRNELQEAKSVQEGFLPKYEAPTVYGGEEGKRHPRRMGVMAGKMYQRMVGGINAIIETEAAILMWRDRIDEMVRTEAESGEVNEEISKAMEIYRKLLAMHTEQRKALGLIGTSQDSLKVSLDVQGIGESFGKGVAEAVSNPQSRTKIMAIIKRLTGGTTETEGNQS